MRKRGDRPRLLGSCLISTKLRHQFCNERVFSRNGGIRTATAFCMMSGLDESGVGEMIMGLRQKSVEIGERMEVVWGEGGKKK
jgi:hypothetical protein